MEEGVDDEARRQRRSAGRQRLPHLLLLCLALPTGGSPDQANVTVDLGQRVELPCPHNQVFARPLSGNPLLLILFCSMRYLWR